MGAVETIRLIPYIGGLLNRQVGQNWHFGGWFWLWPPYGNACSRIIIGLDAIRVLCSRKKSKVPLLLWQKNRGALFSDIFMKFGVESSDFDSEMCPGCHTGTHVPVRKNALPAIRVHVFPYIFYWLVGFPIWWKVKKIWSEVSAVKNFVWQHRGSRGHFGQKARGSERVKQKILQFHNHTNFPSR